MSQVYESPAGSVVIYVVPADSQLLPDEATVYIGKHRASFLRSPVTASHSVEDVLQDIDDRVEDILQTVSFTDDMVAAALSSRVPSGSSGTDSFTTSIPAFKSSLGEDSVLFSSNCLSQPALRVCITAASHTPVLCPRIEAVGARFQPNNT